ncbi:WhiB family transcriptional regulator [Kitasatospora sp. NPDC002551]|uniref:WhiB family transcriptional regulator n=1 Tax=Kitasatospora sp. NPDC002551 TaxID=3154539 RepID=UPI0033252E25
MTTAITPGSVRAASPLPLNVDDQVLSCRTTDPDLWNSPVHAEQLLAADLCHDCPYMLACRSWARATGQAGVCGGETPAERRRTHTADAAGRLTAADVNG